MILFSPLVNDLTHRIFQTHVGDCRFINDHTRGVRDGCRRKITTFLYFPSNCFSIRMIDTNSGKFIIHIRIFSLPFNITGTYVNSSCRTGIYGGAGDIKWQGKDPNMNDEFSTIGINHSYGKTIGWKIKEGRDFSAASVTDSTGMIVNEAAVAYMGLKNPVGQIID